MDRSCSPSDQQRDWRLYAVLAATLLTVALFLNWLARLDHRWFPGIYKWLVALDDSWFPGISNCPLLIGQGAFAACLMSAVCGAPRLSPEARFYLSRGVVTGWFVHMGLWVGLRYIHLCESGSRLVEGLAVFGTPLIAGAAVAAIQRRSVAYGLATVILFAVWLLARPYLDWAHGS